MQDNSAWMIWGRLLLVTVQNSYSFYTSTNKKDEKEDVQIAILSGDA